MSAGHSSSKIVVILKVAAIAVVVLVILFWLVTGGIGRSVSSGGSYFNPVAWYMGDSSATGTLFHLPWRPAEVPRGPDISDYSSTAGDQFTRSELENRAAIEEEYRRANAEDPRTYGNPSPSRGLVTLVRQVTPESELSKEYISLTANSYNTVPIQISGWSVQSAVSGLRAYIPPGTPLFVLGSINTLQPIYLESGATATVISGPSPVSVSFRENICTGYLNELQSFTPELPLSCPDSSSSLPLTAENIRTYGEACIDYLSTVERCHFPTDLPDTLSPACRTFLSNNFSYNGCVRTHQKAGYFAQPNWHIYLGAPSELWQNMHDVIRLLDEKGQVVDVLTY